MINYKLYAILAILGLCNSVTEASKEDAIDELRETLRRLQVKPPLRSFDRLVHENQQINYFGQISQSVNIFYLYSMNSRN